MEELITLLDDNLICTDVDISDRFIHFSVISTRKECACPSFQFASSLVHSHYNHSFQDLPIQNKKVIISISNRKIFAEAFSFLDNKAKKTRRLKETILEVSLTQSSVSAEEIAAMYQARWQI